MDADGDGLGDACDPCIYDSGNDADGDGYCIECSPVAEAGATFDQIGGPDPLLQMGCGDCNDDDSAIHPDADEVCDNGIDDDCDELVDCEDDECDGDLACYVRCDGLDLCEWDVQLPMGSVDNSGCGLTYFTEWPLNTERTVTCTFDGVQNPESRLYISIDNDVLECHLNGETIVEDYMHENCAPQDPLDALDGVTSGPTGGVNKQINPQNGSNTLVCRIKDRGVMSHFDACVVGSGECADHEVMGQTCDNDLDDDCDGLVDEEDPDCCVDSDGDGVYDPGQPQCCVDPEPAQPDAGVFTVQELPYCDNCPDTPNGPDLGTCVSTGLQFQLYEAEVDEDGICTENVDCGPLGLCEMNQSDVDFDGVGDVCDDCQDVDGDGFCACGDMLFMPPRLVDLNEESGEALVVSTSTTLPELPEECDCNDADDSIHPGAVDPLNDGVDQNCVNNPPVCSIDDPLAGTQYVHMSAPVNINFFGVIGDEEDCLDVFWDFGNGQNATGNTCDGVIVLPDGVSASAVSFDNTTEEPSVYDGLGTYYITLTVTESGGLTVLEDGGVSEGWPRNASDETSIFIKRQQRPPVTSTTQPEPPTTSTTLPAPPEPTTTTLPAPPTTVTTLAPTTTTTLREGGGEEEGEVVDEEPQIIGYAALPIDYSGLRSSGLRNLIILLVLMAGYAVWARDTQLMKREVK